MWTNDTGITYMPTVYVSQTRSIRQQCCQTSGNSIISTRLPPPSHPSSPSPPPQLLPAPAFSLLHSLPLPIEEDTVSTKEGRKTKNRVDINSVNTTYAHTHTHTQSMPVQAQSTTTQTPR